MRPSPSTRNDIEPDPSALRTASVLRAEPRGLALAAPAQPPRAPPIAPAELVRRALDYADATGYALQVQWTLIEGVNDGGDEIDGLAAWLAGRRAVLNLIPFNPIDASPFRRPPWEQAAAMARALHRRGVLAKLRRSAAQEVDGACGQLRARRLAAAPG